jgi:undecaprenyl pyrophosphate phosphatase UppP
MAAGLWRGLSHEDAARFAFLLATPVIAGGLMVDQTTATLNNLRLGSPEPVRLLNGATATLHVAAISKPPPAAARTAASSRSPSTP